MAQVAGNGGAGLSGANRGGSSGAGAATARCGNGELESGESCDDGNTLPGDGCAGDCRAEPVKVVAFADTTCALSSIGQIKCWGYNFYGWLGLGDRRERGVEPEEMGEHLKAVDLGSGRRAIDVFAGPCVLLDDGSLKCWGHNASGGLGLGDFSDRGVDTGQLGDALPEVQLGMDRAAIAVSRNDNHSCAILDDDSLKCWGGNTFGPLGLGDEEFRGILPGQMGDALPAVDLGTGRSARAVSVAGWRTCAVLDNGSLKCWGYNRTSQLGLGDKEFRGDEPGEMGDALPKVDLGSDAFVLGVSAGFSNTCAILEGGSLKCFGRNFLGELGLGDRERRGDDLAEMGDALPRVDLGSGVTIVDVGVGSSHACALLDDASLKCWGDSILGQCGLGDTDTRGDEPGEMGDALPRVDLGTNRSVRALSVGSRHSCAVLDNGTLKCWGNNDNGQLGLGDRNARGDEPGEMGDALPSVDLAF